MVEQIKYKIIFSDLDQTLIVNNHIPNFNLEAIKKAREKGVKFVICTGRNFDYMSHLLKELKTENSENEYSICNSGSTIYENKNQKLIYFKGSAISYGEDGKAFIDPAICKGCGRCIGACAFDAIENQNEDAFEMLDRRMAEYAYAVCKGRPHFHISIATDISPNCDCHGENDAPILPNVGMFASFDPVAIDQAAVDMCQKMPPIPNSQLGNNLAKEDWHHHHDVFLDSNPDVHYKETLEQAEKIGLGTREYELIVM